MKNKPSHAGIFCGMLLFLLPQALQADSLKSAAKSINKEFEQVTITAKVPLKFKAKYHVTNVGGTWGKDDSQGAKSGLTRTGDMAFSEGDTAKQLWVNPKSDDKILVRMFCCGNSKRGLFSTTQHVDIYIHPEAPLNGETLTANLIANALSGFFDFEGYNNEAAKSVLEDLAHDLETTGSSSTASPSNSKHTLQEATVLSTAIRVTPEHANRGETVLLEMSFKIGAPIGSEIIVEESRSLLFNGQTLPGYPHTTQQTRTAGEFTSQLPQVIPPSASSGTYEYRGEVCVQGECISRRASLEIRP